MVHASPLAVALVTMLVKVTPTVLPCAEDATHGKRLKTMLKYNCNFKETLSMQSQLLLFASICQGGSWQCANEECAAVCTSWGDGHLITFDGSTADLSMGCEHVMATGTEAGGHGFIVAIQVKKYLFYYTCAISNISIVCT
jgi:hypothetical protein